VAGEADEYFEEGEVYGAYEGVRRRGEGFPEPCRCTAGSWSSDIRSRLTTNIRLPPRGNVVSSSSSVLLVQVESITSESVKRASSSLMYPA
jgi:hypothetical protein